MDLYSYVTWLIIVSLFCLVLERITPWRKQKMLRPQLFQDIIWLAFNGYYLAVVFGALFTFTGNLVGDLFLQMGLPKPEEINLLNTQPFWIQFIALLILQDSLEGTQWNIFLNPFDIPRNTNEVIWEGTIHKNRIFMAISMLVFVLYGLFNLQKREKFV